MKAIFFGCFLLCTIFAHISSESAPEVKEEDDVMILTEKNFDHVVTTNDHLLVEFYAPWCGHCKALAPEYAKAAKSLKDDDSGIKLAKVDATVEKSLATKYNIRGYPTLKFFRNGNPTEFQGGRKADDIVNWLKKKTGPPCTVLHSDSDLNSFKSDNEVSVIGHFSSAGEAGAKNYEDAAAAIDDLPFGIVFDSAVAGTAEIPINTVTVFKKFDEGRADYDGDLSDMAALTKFIKINSLPLVIEFTQESASRIFGGDITIHNILFVSKTSGDFEKHHEAFKQAAAEFKGKVLFIFIDTDAEDNKRVMEFFGITEKDIPVIRIVKMSDKMAKFKPESKELTKEVISQFTGDVLSGKAKRHLMSQEIPEDWDKNPVTVLVGKNFRDVVLDQSKKVFVEFYAPWCGHCKSLKPVYEKLGEHYKDNKDVVIAMMDATANEVEGFDVSGFPTLKFVPSGSDKVLDYGGDRTVEAMIEYIDSNGEKVSGDDTSEEEVDQVRPPTNPLPPKETAPPPSGGGPSSADATKAASEQLDKIQEDMMKELGQMKENFQKQADKKQEL